MARFGFEPVPLNFFIKSVDKVCNLSRPMLAADLHQHLWPDPLLAALARRAHSSSTAPRDGAGGCWSCAGEAASELRLVDHDPVSRALLAERDGVGLVGVAPSSPLGIESLPPDEAAPLLAAFFDGVLELGLPFRPWAAAALAAPGAGALESTRSWTAARSAPACRPRRSRARSGSCGTPRCSTASRRARRRCSCTPGRPGRAAARPPGGRR